MSIGCDEERTGGGSIRTEKSKIPWNEVEECMLDERIVRVADGLTCVLLSAMDCTMMLFTISVASSSLVLVFHSDHRDSNAALQETDLPFHHSVS